MSCANSINVDGLKRCCEEGFVDMLVEDVIKRDACEIRARCKCDLSGERWKDPSIVVLANEVTRRVEHFATVYWLQ